MEQNEVLKEITQLIQECAITKSTDTVCVNIAHTALNALRSIKDKKGLALSEKVQAQLVESRIIINALLGTQGGIDIINDVSTMIKNFVDTGIIPQYEGGRGSNPQQWVQNYIVPKLPEQMRYIAFDQKVYSRSIPKLYTAIRTWRATGKDRVEKFYSSR